MAKIMSQRRQLQGAVAGASDAGQMIDASGMIEAGRERVPKEQLARDAGERNAGQAAKRRCSE
jgi:hypothetical protein